MILLSPWNPKARLWVKGRQKLVETIKTSMALRRPSQLIWMHCSSLGEFEQGRPALERLKSMYPTASILVTFFSSSGYEIRKKYKGADFIFYLPIDSRANAKWFLDTVQPTIVLWVKYDYWYYYITEIRKRGIALLLLSAIFKEHFLFFKWYGNFYRNILRCFSHIFVQNSESKILLGTIGFSKNVSISGDTRFDRVIEIAEQFKPIAPIERFCGDLPVIVAGSTWQEDDEELDHFANTQPGIRFIIAPHEIGDAHLKETKKLFLHSIFYSEFQRQVETGTFRHPGTANVLIIDNIGMLSRLYKYASIAYIGGGFGNDGVHNVLEAAVFGKPVVFGPVYEQFVEAQELLNSGGAFSIENALDLEDVFKILLKSSHEYTKASEASKNYVYSKKGATEIITSYIVKNNLLTELAG